MITCRECGELFDPKHPKHKGGFINVCGDCGHETAIKTLGMIVTTGKTDVAVQIVRKPSTEIAAFIKRQGKCGPSHCFTSLGLQSSGANTAKDKMDKVHGFLYNETQD